METELDGAMKEFEELMDRRPFLVNDVMLRRNVNDVIEWEKRVALHGDDDEKARSLFTSISIPRLVKLITRPVAACSGRRDVQQGLDGHQPSQDRHSSLPSLRGFRQVLRVGRRLERT